jgi:predicted house-cleaning noncanonical NTP pyrophosphatase (MazG superfamily)
MADLAYFLQAPTVIRSDVSSEIADRFLLPRTDKRLTPARARGFMVRTIKALMSAGASPDSIAFILHRFIPARASAWSLAAPGHPSVWVDGTWGLPDGLLFYPHDSFEVDEDGRILDQKVRAKSRIVDFDEHANFVTREPGPPWDWKPALDAETLSVIRDDSVAIADRLGQPVETMFFLETPAHFSNTHVLPWYYTTDIRPSELSKTESHFSSAVYPIRVAADLHKFAADAKANPAWARRVGLRPDFNLELLRDERFLSQVADLAVTTGSHVEFSGSLLSHTFSILQRKGVHVRAVDPYEPRGERLRFNKLVRDRIPDAIEERGERVQTARLSAFDRERLMLRKLVEEVVEVRRARTPEERAAELADLLEVVSGIAEILGLSLADLERAMSAKREARGGFERGLVLVETYLPSVAEVTGKSSGRELRISGTEAERRLTSDEPRLQRPHRNTEETPIIHLLVPLTAAVMADEEEVALLQVGEEYVVEVAYLADHLEVVVRQADSEQHPGQLTLSL